MSTWLAPRANSKDALIGAVGAALGMALTWLICDWVLDGAAPLLVMSMGASAVLLFATPTSPLAQPLPMISSHALGAFVGVASARLIHNTPLAVGVAVGVTAGVIVRFGITHPASGGTALSAVIGGDAITNLGWEFIWHPVLLNVVLLVALAVVVNAPFAWRRYPLQLRSSS
jgi:CBS-domain-containing membrane protein